MSLITFDWGISKIDREVAQAPVRARPQDRPREFRDALDQYVADFKAYQTSGTPARASHRGLGARVVTSLLAWI